MKDSKKGSRNNERQKKNLTVIRKMAVNKKFIEISHRSQQILVVCFFFYFSRNLSYFPKIIIRKENENNL